MRHIVLVFLLVVAVGLTACSRGTDRLDKLKSDPMAAAELQAALNVKVTESRGGTALGIPSPAKIRRTFTVATGTVPLAIAELAEQARAAGWTLRRLPATGFGGDKTIDGLFIQIDINGNEDSNLVWVELWTMDS